LKYPLDFVQNTELHDDDEYVTGLHYYRLAIHRLTSNVTGNADVSDHQAVGEGMPPSCVESCDVEEKKGVGELALNNLQRISLNRNN
jgi:hypothetical protein